MARYHIPNRLRQSTQREMAAKMGLGDNANLCLDKRIYVKEVSKAERIKQDSWLSVAAASDTTVPPQVGEQWTVAGHRNDRDKYSEVMVALCCRASWTTSLRTMFVIWWCPRTSWPRPGGSRGSSRPAQRIRTSDLWRSLAITTFCCQPGR